MKKNISYPPSFLPLNKPKCRLAQTFLATAMLLLSTQAHSQSQNWWRSNGNTPATGDYLGTSNSADLIFKTNNLTRFTITATGSLNVATFTGTASRLVYTDAAGNLIALPTTSLGAFLSANGAWGSLPLSATVWSVSGNNINSTNTGSTTINSNFIFGTAGAFRNTAWAGTTNRLLQTNASGVVSPFANGTTGQYLDGTGAWLNLPTALNSFSVTGNKIYTAPSMSLGIGTNNPQYLLDVAGDARIQNNLYVGGGIVITDRVHAAETVTASMVRADTMRTPVVIGNTRFTGNIDATANMSVQAVQAASLTAVGTINAGGDVTANSKLTVNGNASFNGNFKLANLAGTSAGLVYVDSLGNLSRVIPTGASPSCNQVVPWFVGGNNLSPSIDNTIGTCSNRDFILKANNSSAIWVKTDGKIGINTVNPIAKLDITGTGMTDGIRYNSINTSAPAFQIAAANSPTFSRFLTYGDGRTFIGQFTSPANDFDATGSMLTVAQSNVNYKAINLVNNTNPTAPTDFFSVFGDGKTQIGTGQFLSPNKLLTVNGDVLFANNGVTAPTNHQYDGYSGFEILGGDRVPSRRGISVEDDPSGDLSFFINSNQSSGGPQFRFKNGNGTATTASAIPDLFVINQNGTTKINVYSAPSAGGTPNVVDALDIWNVADGKSNFRVKSNGEAYARYMKVSVNFFPDYVFKSDYKLPKLEEVEAYYKANKHLPEIPTAAVVQKDGLDLGAINTLLVKKVEELTIYAVEQNKTTQAQQALLVELQKQLEVLKKQVNTK